MSLRLVSPDTSEILDSTSLETCPIPRRGKNIELVNPYVPSYEPNHSEFSFDIFQMYFSLVNFHLKSYDLAQTQECSPAVECLGHAFELKKDPVLTEAMPRKYLLEANHQFHIQTKERNLVKIGMLHNDLFYVSELLSLYKMSQKLLDLCNMIMAETYDLFNSVFLQTVDKMWEMNKTGEEVINELLKKEIEKIRQLNNKSNELLSRCIIQRAKEHAPSDQISKITQWAHDNHIID